MINASVTLGIILSFTISELVGLLSGGLVGPGYLALYMDQPMRIAITLLVSGITYLSVKLLSNYIILFGKRRFMAMVICGLLIGWFASKITSWLPIVGQNFEVIGYIIPGLIANDAYKQGFGKTAVCTLAVAGIIRLALILIF